MTISDEAGDKLTEIVIDQELESTAEAIDYPADAVRAQEILLKAELVRLLHRKLAD